MTTPVRPPTHSVDIQPYILEAFRELTDVPILLVSDIMRSRHTSLYFNQDPLVRQITPVDISNHHNLEPFVFQRQWKLDSPSADHHAIQDVFLRTGMRSVEQYAHALSEVYRITSWILHDPRVSLYGLLAHYRPITRPHPTSTVHPLASLHLAWAASDTFDTHLEPIVSYWRAVAAAKDR